MFFRALLWSGLLASISGTALSQQPVRLDSDAILQLVTHRVEPVYPPIAKAAHIQGTVVFAVEISSLGKLDSTRIASGPAMLQQAAIDALKQWTFKPFVRNGAAVQVAGEIHIDFSLGDSPEAIRKDEAIADRFFKADEACHKAIAKRDNSTETGALCRQAADIADEFAPDARFIERRSSYVYAAWGLANCQDFKTALVYANKAVAVVQLGHDDNSGSSAAFGIRGIVEGDLNDLSAADRDLTTAEDYGRKALAWARQQNFEHADSYVNSQLLYLRLHSALLLALNRPDDARKKLEEMETLK